MQLIDFIKKANGLDEEGKPKSTAIICLVELEEESDGGIVSNIKQKMELLTPNIHMDYFVDGCDENGYIEVRLEFGNPNGHEIRMAWNILEKYRELNSFENIPIDMDVETKSDTMVELMVMAKENSETKPVFLEMAFPINFILCSSKPGRIADTLNMFFNINSLCIHENDYLDMEELEKEVDDCVSQLEREYRSTLSDLEEQRQSEEKNHHKQMEAMEAVLKRPESAHRTGLGGSQDEA